MFPMQPSGPRPPNRVTFAMQILHMLSDPSHHWGPQGPDDGADREAWQKPTHNSVDGKSLEGTSELRDDVVQVLRQYVRGEIPDEAGPAPMDVDLLENVLERLETVESELGIDDPPEPGETDVEIEMTDELKKRLDDIELSDEEVDQCLGRIERLNEGGNT